MVKKSRETSIQPYSPTPELRQLFKLFPEARGKPPEFQSELLSIIKRYGPLAVISRGRDWARTFVWNNVESKFESRKFVDLKASVKLLAALVKLHSGNKVLERYAIFSEDYIHPDIGEFARVTGNSVKFLDNHLEERQNPSTDARAHDVAHVVLSVNLPVAVEKHREATGKDYFLNSEDTVPNGPLGLDGFALEYAKKAKLRNKLTFVEKCKEWYNKLFYMHNDHAADHM